MQLDRRSFTRIAVGKLQREQPGRTSNRDRRRRLGITDIPGTSGHTTSTNYVTCGNGKRRGFVINLHAQQFTSGYDLGPTLPCMAAGPIVPGPAGLYRYYSTVTRHDFLPLVGQFHPDAVASSPPRE